MIWKVREEGKAESSMDPIAAATEPIDGQQDLHLMEKVYGMTWREAWQGTHYEGGMTRDTL